MPENMFGLKSVCFDDVSGIRDPHSALSITNAGKTTAIFRRRNSGRSGGECEIDAATMRFTSGSVCARAKVAPCCCNNDFVISVVDER